MIQKRLSGKAQTVLGAIDSDSLGITMVHEHILDDLKMYLMEPSTDSERALINVPIQIENLYLVRLHPFNNLDNLCMNDKEMAIKETALFKSAGGNTIIEVTTDSAMGRDPSGLVAIARKTGLNIVMGTGYYMAASHVPELVAMTEQEISESFIKEIIVGVGNTEIKAGIIGEIGCSKPLTENEYKILHCCATAQQQTGAAIYIHPGPDDDIALEITRVLTEAGADLNRVVIGHVDILNFSEKTCRALMDKGCYIAYDNFGNEGFFQLPHQSRYFEANDVNRINDIIKYSREGYLSQILVSQDAGTKERLTSYGGTGYAHILRDILPIMRIKGLSDAQIQTILVENPKRVITFA